MSWGQFDYSQQQDLSQHYNYYQQQSPYTQSQSYYGGQMFMPPSVNDGTVTGGVEDYENEPPLLEELGINFSHIKEKTFAVLNPAGAASAEVIADQDLAGPLVFCLLFGFALLLHGKMTFGYIYGIGALGCLGIYALMNLMAADKTISFVCTASVLGYCLLPMSLLSLVTAVLSSKGVFGYSLSALAVVWCSSSSSKLFVITLSMQHQRLLVAYPCVLLYSVFALLALF
uniref:Protein YIPF n=1 Tax=Angiostrongylus cantonensis TaxID=6313 RepID=A0A0K0CUP6_ANGCA